MQVQNRSSDELKKRNAVSRVIDRGYPVAEATERLGVSRKSIYTLSNERKY